MRDIIIKTDSKMENIGFTNDVCADGICCFMSIPWKQNHLGIWKPFLQRRSASYGIKLLYTSQQTKDIIYNPCRCLDFYLKEITTPDGNTINVLLRCGIFGKKCRPLIPVLNFQTRQTALCMTFQPLVLIMNI